MMNILIITTSYRVGLGRVRAFQVELMKLFFLIVGDGTDFEKLSAWFETKKPRNAKLIKSLPRDEYNKLFAASDVGLILLRKEITIPNFPSRLLSYLENKISVVCFTSSVTDIGKISKKIILIYCQNTVISNKQKEE